MPNTPQDTQTLLSALHAAQRHHEEQQELASLIRQGLTAVEPIVKNFTPEEVVATAKVFHEFLSTPISAEVKGLNHFAS